MWSSGNMGAGQCALFSLFSLFSFFFCFNCLISFYALIFLRRNFRSKMFAIAVLFLEHETLNQILYNLYYFFITVKCFMPFSVSPSCFFLLCILHSTFHLVNWMVQVRNSTNILTKEFIDALPNGWTNYAWRRINKGILL